MVGISIQPGTPGRSTSLALLPQHRGSRLPTAAPCKASARNSGLVRPKETSASAQSASRASKQQQQQQLQRRRAASEEPQPSSGVQLPQRSGNSCKKGSDGRAPSSTHKADASSAAAAAANAAAANLHPKPTSRSRSSSSPAGQTARPPQQQHSKVPPTPATALSQHTSNQHANRAQKAGRQQQGSGRSSLSPPQLTAHITAPDTNSPEVLLQLVQQHTADMNHIHLSAAYTQAVKVCQQGVPVQQQPAAVQELLSVLQQLAVMLHQQCGARELANIIWSCSRLCCADTSGLLLPVFLQDSILQQAAPQAVSNVLWAVANMGQQLPAQQLQVLLQRFAELLPKANSQAVSNVLWAVAALGQQLPAQQLQVLMQRFAELLPQANPQAVSNTLWAVASMGQQLPVQQLQALLQIFEELLPQAKPQEVSNTLWAVATMEQQLQGDQLPKLLQRFAELLPQAKPQAVSNTLWAVATMGQQLPAQQLQTVLQRFIELLAQAKPQEVSNTLWAVATVGQQLPAQQLQALIRIIVVLLHQAKPQEVSTTLWACGRLRFAPEQLLSTLEQQPQQLRIILAGAKPQDLANMAWACGQLGQDMSKQLTTALLQQAVRMLQDSSDTGSFQSQDLCNLCWSAAVQDLQDCVPHMLQLAGACRQLWSTAVAEELRQLYQVHMWLLDKQLPSSAVGLLGVLSEEQLEQCRASWEQQLTARTAQTKSSALHRSVFAAVQQLPSGTWQQQPVMEQRTADGVFSIDIAATTAAGVRVAIEVDGPSHFVQPDNTLNGPSQSRNRALAARGYHVMSISHWEWRRLRESDKQQAYLQCKLQGVLEHR